MIATTAFCPCTDILGATKVGFVVLAILVARLAVHGGKVSDQSHRFSGSPSDRLTYITFNNQNLGLRCGQCLSIGASL
ncbi:hypothetical protein D3C85_1429880 [compost metagenome]